MGCVGGEGGRRGEDGGGEGGGVRWGTGVRGRGMFVEVWATKRSVVNSQHSVRHKCHVIVLIVVGRV